MTENERKIIEYLKTHALGYVSPTEIGRVVGGNGRHSAWASPICKRLVRKGLAKRNERGWYAAL
ncbi:MAG TPA: hypothetical protein VJ987_07275 [Anaerolineales bacterium]|nr:hypothetical protein [Anaerolineales bacterium]